MKRKKGILSQAGQTSVEYILLISMVAIISLGLFKNLEKYIISNPDSMLNSYLDSLALTFGAGGSGEYQYKRFVLRR